MTENETKTLRARLASPGSYAIVSVIYLTIILGYFVLNGLVPSAFVVGTLLGRIIGSLFWAWVIWLVSKFISPKDIPPDRDRYLFGGGSILLGIMIIVDLSRYSSALAG